MEDRIEGGRTRIEGSEEVQGPEKGGWSVVATAKAVVLYRFSGTMCREGDRGEGYR